ncbi:GTPase LSG1-2 [Aristolochia californica]|uniref:GTPase LSG1-2 n=1 Tax=Aristolochia californica TaxID=171875 RepID=UPI0035E22D9E
MGKNEKTSLGRALVKHHNQLIQQSKEKGRAISRSQRGVLESITDIGDIEAVIEQAEEAERVYSLDNPIPNLLIDTDRNSQMSVVPPEERRKLQKEEESLHTSSLRVPRRPPWSSNMSAEELDSNERQAFLIWRRNLARLEENEKLVLTPFEKNLDIWRQLWRVLERSDLVVMVVDARDPLFYRCPDLEAYAREIDEHKRMLLLVNKADLLPVTVRQKWAEYFSLHSILFVFWSAKVASASLESKKNPLNPVGEENYVDADTKIYGRDELLARLQTEAEAIASHRKQLGSDGSSRLPHSGAGILPSKHATVGFVGYPNVGKSSTINALVGKKRTGVTSTPGKTKHFQTLSISDELVLCDCPGLVFPSFSSSRYEMIACGVLPIDRITEHREAVQVVANRLPRDVLESIYNITLPKPKPYEPQTRPPLASEVLRAYCSSRGYVGSSGLPDETRAARQILKDYIDGKLPHYEMPPGLSPDGNGGIADQGDLDGDQSDHSEVDVDDPLMCTAGDPSIEPDAMLNDLESFDSVNADSSSAAKKKGSTNNTTSHKHHKKPQRKKDRSWRVQNDNGDGMPVVRVFQKPPVNLEALKTAS